MKKTTYFLLLLLLLTALNLTSCNRAGQVYKLAWSHYTGWEPWGYAGSKGIVDKWAKKYNIKIDVVLVNDYIESINLYTTGEFDGCVMTNMDGLTIPAVGGVDSTALIIGDFSAGNDAIVLKNGSSVADLAGRKVKLVELSVSHYLLARALEQYRLSERDIEVINTSDADIGSIFVSDPDPRAATVTWNPILMQIRNAPGASVVFDSSRIPGEIIDLTVVRTAAPESFKKALSGAWYELMSLIQQNPSPGAEAIVFMAEQSGATPAEFIEQLKTTAMFYKPAEAVAFSRDSKLKETMEYVRKFSFAHGLYGEGADSADYVGIQFPDGAVIGDKNNIKFRYTDTYMNLAAEGKL